MRAYGYVRISRDEDGKKESIDTQRRVVLDYAKSQNIELIEVFEDNNATGYTFDRPGISQLKQLIEAGKVDAIFAKDLSRIGRHNAKVLLFLDYLDDHGVRILLMNDNYDSNRDDDTMIGIKSWVNEMYLKDISRKIRTNMRQKQKEGLVIVESFGFKKVPNLKNKLVIDDKAADTVRLIYRLYIEGLGCTLIAKRLNELRIQTPSIYKQETQGFGWKKDWTQKDLWYATAVKRILRNDAYIGTLRCGVVQTLKMKGKKVRVDESKQFVHPNFMPAIISIEDFEQVKSIFDSRVEGRVKTGHDRVHRYAGLLKCATCGKGFVARTRKSKSGFTRVVYNCTTHFRYGAAFCTPHIIDEVDLDNAIFSKLREALYYGELNQGEIERKIELKRMISQPRAESIGKLKEELFQKRNEVKEYARQLARHLIDDDLYEELVLETHDGIRVLESRLVEMEKSVVNAEHEKKDVSSCLTRIREVLDKEHITNADISVLIHHIEIKETNRIGAYGVPDIELEIFWNVPGISYLKSEVESECA